MLPKIPRILWPSPPSSERPSLVTTGKSHMQQRCNSTYKKKPTLGMRRFTNSQSSLAQQWKAAVGFDNTLGCWKSEAHCSKQVPAEGTTDQQRPDDLVVTVTIRHGPKAFNGAAGSDKCWFVCCLADWILPSSHDERRKAVFGGGGRHQSTTSSLMCCTNNDRRSVLKVMQPTAILQAD